MFLIWKAKSIHWSEQAMLDGANAVNLAQSSSDDSNRIVL